MPTIRDLIAQSNGWRSSTHRKRSRDALRKGAAAVPVAKSKAPAMTTPAASRSGPGGSFDVSPLPQTSGLGDAAMPAYRPSAKQRPWIQVDYTFSFFLCVAGGMMFAAALSGWLVILSDLSELKDRLATVRAERLDLTSDVRSRIESVSAKLDAIEVHLQQAEQTGRKALEAIDARLAQFGRSEEEFGKARQEQASARERQQPDR